jgi:two-component system, sensor histidine kinase YesM
MGIFSRHIKFSSIRQKIMFVISLSIFLTLLATVVIFYSVLEVNNRQLFTQISSNLLLAAENLNQKFTTISQFSSTIVADKEIQKLLIQHKDRGDYTSFTKASEGINTILSIYHDQLVKLYVDSIVIEGQGISSSSYIPREQEIPEAITRELVALSKNQYGSFYVTTYSSSYGIFLVYPIRRFLQPRFDYLGTLIISIKPERIFSQLAPEGININEIQYVLFDNADQTIFSSDSTLSAAALLNIDYSSSSYDILDDSGSTYMITGREISMGWKIFTLLPYSSILQTSNFLRSMSIIIVSAIGLISIIVTYNILRNSFTRPIHELVIQMKDFGVSIEPLTSIKEHFIHRRDEIGYLYNSFERMTTDILSLIEVNYKNELLYKESQLKYLQAQINPHFLFNTLDSISWRSKLANDPVTTKIVESLSVLLRGSLSEKKFFSLEEEMALARHYLTIQQIRYGKHLSYTIACSDSLLSLCFPHMVLQPIIENAIKYSLEFNGEQCHIDLSAVSQDGILTVTIQNSGSQFEENHLQKLEEHSLETSGFGIGLMNIQQRIQLNYGPEYGLYLFNNEGKAVVSIRLPAQVKKQTYAENDDS